MSQLYQTAVWKEALRSTESEPRKMLPCAFHKGEEEGLLCCGDRGSLKDAVSIVKEGLCVWWGSQCGHCEGEAAGIRCQSEEGELFWFSIWCFVATVDIKCSFGFFFNKGARRTVRHSLPKQAMVWLCRWRTLVDTREQRHNRLHEATLHVCSHSLTHTC